ncbi:LpxL/LpxP family acyltransferase [Flexibacterium corallicola]|uniref:LpxL/LpxP family acyltransferase n=1 Tax=Flexibacterium corallicola TaxID=3037259 RepID=UPI00286F6F83|nr:tetratricopeptide repeat protein [Pseudovibrio sp. M1P-2-3]
MDNLETGGKIDKRPSFAKLKELRQKARDAQKTGNYSRAARLFSELREVNPNNLAATLGLVRAQQALGEYVEALALAKRALKSWPEKEKLLRQLALLYNALGDYRKAAEFSRQLLTKDPENLLGLRTELSSLLLLGEYDDVELKIERALESHPSDVILRRIYIRLNRVLPLTQKSLTRSAEWFKESPADRIYISFYLECLRHFNLEKEEQQAISKYKQARQQEGECRTAVEFRTRLNEVPAIPETTKVLCRSIQALLCSKETSARTYEQEMAWGIAAGRLAAHTFFNLPDDAEDMQELFCQPDLSVIETALAKGKGCMLVTSHHGPNMAACWFLERHFPKFKRVGDERILSVSHRPQSSIRPASATSIILGGKSKMQLRSLLDALQQNCVLGIACDGFSSSSSVEVDFLRGSLKVWDLPARLSVTYGIPTIWCQAYWHGEKINIEIEEIAISGQLRDSASATTEWARCFVSKLERHLCRGPKNFIYSRKFWARALGAYPN